MGMAMASAEKFNEIKILDGHTKKNNIRSALPHTYVNPDDLPEAFTWGNVNGKCYLTKALNQHLPNYCGSCWAHGSISALADRIKIAREGTPGPDINLSIQFILNCGADIAGSCHGGYHTGVYELIQTMGNVPFHTCHAPVNRTRDSVHTLILHAPRQISVRPVTPSVRLVDSAQRLIVTPMRPLQSMD